jgi:hypothetical protein
VGIEIRSRPGFSKEENDGIVGIKNQKSTFDPI